MIFIGFMASSAGRFTRVVAGLALIGIGLVALHGAGGVALAVVGAIPLAAGVFDFCIFAPLFRLPFLGPAIRARVAR